MSKVFGFSAMLLCLVSVQAIAGDRISRQQIQQVMDASDQAARNRDAQGIGAYLGTKFYKYVDLPEEETPLAVALAKKQYLEQIDKGWRKLDSYDYERRDVVINVAADGKSAESFSTVIETFSTGGRNMVSKVREYATYELEDGRPVIVQIESQTLVGDTTPQ